MSLTENIWNNENLIEVLRNGGVVVMPTDTIYGIVGRAENKKTIERIYKIKKRAQEKKCITLIGSWNETKKFGIDSSKFKIPETNEPTTFILENTSFRLPQKKEFQDLLLKTGPLIAPSANTEGLTPAENIAKAKEYFGNSIDLYVDGGDIKGKASKIIKLNKDGTISILRD